MIASVDNLAAVWSSLDELLRQLGPEEWKRPTGCPGWTVQDNVSHLIDYESRALGIEPPASEEPDAARPAHVRNDLGAANEGGVAARRLRPGSEVLAELRTITTARLEQLRGLTDDDLAREMDLPVGRGTLADMLTLRVMDTWSHEQDIRRAVGMPGHTDGPVVDEAVGYLSRFLPIVVVKRAGAPDGAAVAFHLEARPPFAVVVEGGRGTVHQHFDGDATVILRMPVTVFDALVCGRSDVSPSDVGVTGDTALGESVVAALAFIP